MEENKSPLQLLRSSSGIGNPTQMKNLEYLFQGKFIQGEISEDKRYFFLDVIVPKNVNESIVSDAKLFEKIKIKFEFHKLIIGTLNNDLTITLEDNEAILRCFEGRTFMSEFGVPSYVDDIKVLQPINVHINDHLGTPLIEIEFIVPQEGDMPYIKLVFNKLSIQDFDGNNVEFKELVNEMIPFYEHSYLRKKDRQSIELQELIGAKNSLGYYNNKLVNDYWFEYQFQPARTFEPQINKSLGQLIKPLWIITDKSQTEFDDYGYITNLQLVHATKRVQELSKYIANDYEVYWMPSEDHFVNLNVLINELLNCEAEDPFHHLKVNFLNNWFPTETIDKTLLDDLREFVENDEQLSKHPSKDEFFNSWRGVIFERKLVEL